MLHSLGLQVVEAWGATELHEVDVALRAVKDLVHTHDKVLGEDGYRTRKARFQARHGVSVVDFPLKVSATTSRSHGDSQRLQHRCRTSLQPIIRMLVCTRASGRPMQLRAFAPAPAAQAIMFAVLMCVTKAASVGRVFAV